MIYKIGMLCKHFKGSNLIEKLDVNGIDVDENTITYTGDNNLKKATNLVIYSNIFQDNKLFCREYEDISQELSEDKKVMFNQTLKVQPLTVDEEKQIQSNEYIETKKEYILKKYSN